jgi:hypothetical protein
MKLPVLWIAAVLATGIGLASRGQSNGGPCASVDGTNQRALWRGLLSLGRCHQGGGASTKGSPVSTREQERDFCASIAMAKLLP